MEIPPPVLFHYDYVRKSGVRTGLGVHGTKCEKTRGDLQTRPEDGQAKHARRLPSWNVLVGVFSFCGWAYETVRASEKRKAERKSDGGKADRPDQKQARPLREKEPW